MLIFSFIRWILGLSIAILLVGFSVLNRAPVQIHISPVQAPLELPIYSIALGAMLFGFLLGGLLVWINNSTLRKTKRQQKRQIKALEQELEAVNENIPPITTAEKIQTALLLSKK